MKIRHFAVGMLSAVALVLAAWPAAAASCSLLKVASFPIAPQIVGAVGVPVALNGTEETFLVDTGGAFSTVSAKTADKLGLTLRSAPVELYAASGKIFNRYATVHTLRLGHLRAQDVELMVHSGSIDTGRVQFQGTLAPDILRNYDIDFDFGHDRMNMMSPKHCPGAVVYWAPNYSVVPFTMSDRLHIEVPVTLDGHNFKAIVDTGSTFTLLREQQARGVFHLGPDSAGVERIESKSRLIPYSYRFKSLVIGGITVGNPQLGIFADADAQRFRKEHRDKLANDPVYGLRFDSTPMILGLDILTKLHLYIAYGEKTLYVTAAGAGHASAAK